MAQIIVFEPGEQPPHDRDAILWVATTAGISDEMIRDMMVRSLEQRFGAIRAPHPVQWLSDNGSIFAAHMTIEIALALNRRAVAHLRLDLHTWSVS